MAQARTSLGTVRGERRPGSVAYRGIPYAAAPVGELRFAAPVPHPGWSGVRDARANGPTPALAPTADTHSIPEPTYPGEETLNLNVFTPGDGGGLPVYVWVHGGGYVSGTPGGPWFDGASFNGRGVVTVALTYRLGFEGFGDIPGAPGNRGLLDVIAALTWVRENIAAFGGDPDRVTVGGQSAGGGMVLALLAAPRAQQLFRAAVVHSAPMPDITPDHAARTGQAMARACGVPHDLGSWTDVPRERIVATERGLGSGDLWSGVRDLHRLFTGRRPVTDFGPVIDGELLPLPPVESFAAGAGRDRPVLLGTTRHEFNRLTEPMERLLASAARTPLLTSLGLPGPLARAYPRAHPDLSPSELLGQAVTDRVFRIPVVRVALAREESVAPEHGTGDGPAAQPPRAGTWLFDFRWRSRATGRSVHCLDLPFAWNTLGAERVDRLAGPHPPQHLADELHAAVVGHVTHGTPGWPPFSPQAPVARVLDETSWTGRDPYRFERVAAQTI